MLWGSISDFKEVTTMPRIIVEWLEGRSKEQRDKLSEKITEDVVEVVGVDREKVTIVFKENSPDKLYKAGKPVRVKNIN